MAKPDGYRPKKLSDEELHNAVHQVVLKAALHNKAVTVEQITNTTAALVKVIRNVTDA